MKRLTTVPVVLMMALFIFARPVQAQKMSTPSLACAGSTQHTIPLQVTAGTTGAPGGFSIQWMKCTDFSNGTAFNLPGLWPSDSDGAAAGGVLCKASFSGNANSTAWNLGPGKSTTVDIGALNDADPGVSFSCNELQCDTCYVFRVFAHATAKQKRSDFSSTITCSTTTCEDVRFQPGEFCTFSQGGYGGFGEPFNILEAAFGTVWPTGVTVGGINYMTFTAAAFVQAYLPAGGSPGQLTGTYTNPASSSISGGGSFAGQVLTLRLTCGLSDNGVLNQGFASLTLCHTDALVLGGVALTPAQAAALNGQMVLQVLLAAENRLGGGALPYGLTAGQLNELVSLLNLSFDGKYIDGNSVEHPCGMPSDFAQDFLCKP